MAKCKYCGQEVKLNKEQEDTVTFFRMPTDNLLVVCDECEIAIKDHEDNIKAGMCFKCKGSCVDLIDGTECTECGGKGFVR